MSHKGKYEANWHFRNFSALSVLRKKPMFFAAFDQDVLAFLQSACAVRIQ